MSVCYLRSSVDLARESLKSRKFEGSNEGAWKLRERVNQRERERGGGRVMGGRIEGDKEV